MTTRYILGGGYTSKAADGGTSFYQTIVGGRKCAKILICAFAVEADEYESNFINYKNRIVSANPEANLVFQNADPKFFASQIDWADIIVYLGGQSSRLMGTLRNIPNWHSRDLHGKTVVGSSAGAYMLSSAYVLTQEKPGIAAGYNFVPAIVVAHYRKDEKRESDRNYWNKVDIMMQSAADDFCKVYKLREGEFVEHIV